MNEVGGFLYTPAVKYSLDLEQTLTKKKESNDSEVLFIIELSMELAKNEHHILVTIIVVNYYQKTQSKVTHFKI